MAEVKFKGETIQLEGELPQVGAIAPDFVLTTRDLKDMSLSHFQGKKKILSIFPSLDTPVCLKSSKVFNDEAKANQGLMVIGVSADLPFALERVCGFEKIDNVMCLSMMRDRSFAKDYGVLMKNGPLAGIAARAVLALDENNKVIYTELVEDIALEPNYMKVLEAVK